MIIKRELKYKHFIIYLTVHINRVTILKYSNLINKRSNNSIIYYYRTNLYKNKLKSMIEQEYNNIIKEYCI